MVTVKEWQHKNALRRLNGEPELPYPGEDAGPEPAPVKSGKHAGKSKPAAAAADAKPED
jgi:hypothetical protein